MNFAFTSRRQNASLRLKTGRMAEPPAKALRDHHRGYARTRQRILIADRVLLIDKVKIVALGAVDGHRVAPRVGCHVHLFSGRRSHRAVNLKESKS